MATVMSDQGYTNLKSEQDHKRITNAILGRVPYFKTHSRIHCAFLFVGDPPKLALWISFWFFPPSQAIHLRKSTRILPVVIDSLKQMEEQQAQNKTRPNTPKLFEYLPPQPVLKNPVLVAVLTGGSSNASWARPTQHPAVQIGTPWWCP